MNRNEAIEIINFLYPADSTFQEANAIGKELLKEAREFVNKWQSESTEILVKYAELCQEYENKEYEKWLKQWEK